MSESTTLDVGTVVGDKYVIQRPLGEGGMGEVYLAHHRTTGRRVALKWVRLADHVARQRVLREARSMGRLAHPNVAGVLDLGEERGAAFLVMDYYEGHNLRAYVDGNALPPAEAIDLLLPAMAGIAAAHQAGVLHRDIKPENLFVCLDADGTPYDTKVLDFGVAKQLEANDASAVLTHDGAIIGTPRYMAPEQVSSDWEPDERADVFAMGLVLYELVTGRTPYQSTSLKKLVLEILRGEIPRADTFNPDLPAGLVDVLERALASARTDRYADMAALAHAIEPWAGERRFVPPRIVHTPSTQGPGGDNLTLAGFGELALQTRRGQAALAPTMPSAPTPQPRLSEPVTIEDRPHEHGWSAARNTVEPRVDTQPVGTTPSEDPPTSPAEVAHPRKRWVLPLIAALVLGGGLAIGLWARPRAQPAAAAPSTDTTPAVAQAPASQAAGSPAAVDEAAAQRAPHASAVGSAPPADAAPTDVQLTATQAPPSQTAVAEADAASAPPPAATAASPAPAATSTTERKVKKRTPRRRARDNRGADQDSSAVRGRSGVYRAEDF